jgi:predicted DNA-binding protein (MmcQ/YjbR family)
VASADAFRRLALALPGTSEAPHFDRAAFRVARIYATLAADRLSANLNLTPDEQEFKCMMNPAAFSAIPNGWGRQGWTTVMLDKLDEDELRAALEMSWAHAQPKPRSRPRKS